MTAPARPKCTHCGEQPQVRLVPPAAARARTVEVALCACDWPACGACKRAIRDVACPTRCPHCGAVAFVKKGQP